MPTVVPPSDCSNLFARSRSAHWVLRSSDLEPTLRFLREVFDMTVLRHEENDRPCAITCNGNYKKPWSKTMVGYGPEDQGYCLEITYNYGIRNYAVSLGLAHIAIGVEDPEATLERAAELGYRVDGKTVEGPDGYSFLVEALPEGRTERFLHSALRVADLERAKTFYEEVLEMTPLHVTDEAHFASLESFGSSVQAFGYPAGWGTAEDTASTEKVPLVLIEEPEMHHVRREQWEGRHAISMPGPSLRAACARVQEGKAGGSVLHPLREFNELPLLRRQRGLPPMACEAPPPEAEEGGHLAVAVLRDNDGFEVCLVSAETYDMEVARAYQPDMDIDWAWRARAEAGERGPIPERFLAACI